MGGNPGEGFDLLSLQARLDGLQGLGDQLVRGHALPVQSDLPGLDVGQGEEVVNEAVEALGIGLDGLEEFFPLPGILGGGPLEQGLHVADDGRQGRPDLMSHVGYEVHAHPFELFEAGDVVKDHHDLSLVGG